MSDNSPIEWTDATANVINGCTVKSAGCIGCYAMKQAHRFPVRRGLTQQSNGGMVWTGEVRFNEAALLQVLRWKKPRMIFWNAHGDMFHENVPDEWIDRCFAVMALTPHHTHQVLTKRADRMREYFSNLDHQRIISAAHAIDSEGGAWLNADHHIGKLQFLPLINVWLGVSVENQAAADERIPDLLATPAAVRWISAEPLIGPVDLTWIEFPNERGRTEHWDALDLHLVDGEPMPAGNCDATLDWVVCGGESGAKARPMHPDWARSLRDQCAAAGVPFLFKQWGEWAPGEIAGEYLDPEKTAKGMTYDGDKWFLEWSAVDGHCDDEPDVYRVGKKAAGRHLDGVLHDAFPAREARP